MSDMHEMEIYGEKDYHRKESGQNEREEGGKEEDECLEEVEKEGKSIYVRTGKNGDGGEEEEEE